MAPFIYLYQTDIKQTEPVTLPNQATTATKEETKPLLNTAEDKSKLTTDKGTVTSNKPTESTKPVEIKETQPTQPTTTEKKKPEETRVTLEKKEQDENLTSSTVKNADELKKIESLARV